MVWKYVIDKKPKKIEFRKLPNWDNPEIQPFLRMHFFNFFLINMSQEYKKEKSPIIMNDKKQLITWEKSKNKGFKGCWTDPPLWEQPVEMLNASKNKLI